jgi:hypothetical protein
MEAIINQMDLVIYYHLLTKGSNIIIENRRAAVTMKVLAINLCDKIIVVISNNG